MEKVIISLGAGVQSSTMALMAARGEIGPMPDAAIFADTQSEPKAVYEWLEWLTPHLPFPVYQPSKGSLRQAVIDGGHDGRFAAPPFYTTNEHGKREGLLRRQCTREYKVEPIERQIRELCGLAKGERAPKDLHVEQWIGISTDEIQRMKDARPKWLHNRWPLLELSMTRLHCLEWMRDRQYPMPSKSACTFCPYRDNASWQRMKDEDPVSFADAVAVDESIRSGFNKTNQKLYVHSSLVPLADVDFTSPHKNQVAFSFMDECDGMCGV